MKAVHIPQPFITLFLILLSVAFMAGTVLAFGGVRAAPEAGLAPTVTPVPAASPSATAEQAEGPASADTTGILVLGILLVAIILVGLLWGGRMARK